MIDIYETNRISIYGLNYKDDKDSAIKWLKQRGNPYKKNIIDKKGDIGIDFGVYGAPETFLINSKGVIVHKHVGPIDKNYFKNIILPFLKNE